MPLYFFDIVDGESLPDRHGLELENIGEAQAHAMGIAMSFLKQPSSEVWRDNLWSVSIREAARGRLFRLDVQVTQDANSQ